MKPGVGRPQRADLIAAWAIGSGVGLLALMIAWLVGNRLVGLLLEPPRGPTVAFVAAIALGVATTALAGRRLAATVAAEAVQARQSAHEDSSTSGLT